MRPVGSIQKMKQITEEEEEEEDNRVGGLKENDQMIEIPCQCACTATTTSTESLEQNKLREPLSAPF